MKQTLIYDTSSVPEAMGLPLDKIMWIYKEHDIVFYDSFSETGQLVNTPQVVNIPEGVSIQFIDLHENEEGQKLIEKLGSDAP